MKIYVGKREFDSDDPNWAADAAYAWVKGDGPEPYAPAVASLCVLLRAAYDAGKEAAELKWKHEPHCKTWNPIGDDTFDCTCNPTLLPGVKR